MGLIIAGIKAALLGKRFGDEYEQRIRFKEAIEEVIKEEEFDIVFVDFNNQWNQVSSYIDWSQVKSACLCVYPHQESKGLIVLDSSVISKVRVIAMLLEKGVVDARDKSHKYVFELDYYLNGGDHRAESSPFHIYRTITSKASQMKFSL